MATVFTDVGEAQVTDFITGDGSAPANYFIAWGTGTNVAAKGDTALQTESAEGRLAGVETQPSADIAQWVNTMTSSGTQSISEVGLLDASTTGNLFIRKDFTPIALEVDDQIEFTISLEMT